MTEHSTALALLTVAVGFGFLVVVEWMISRRLKNHLLAVDKMLARMMITSDSVDAANLAQKTRIDRIERVGEKTRKDLENLTGRVDSIEKQLRR